MGLFLQEVAGSSSGWTYPSLSVIHSGGLGLDVLLDKQEGNLENLLDSIKCLC